MSPHRTAAPRALLVATDFSEPAQRAAQRGARLARELGCPLHLLHVTQHSLMDEMRAWLDNSGQWQERLAGQTTLALNEAAATLQTDSTWNAEHPLTVHTHALEGATVDTVWARAEALDAGLVVIGRRGSTPLHHLVIGTTAERLLRKAPRPLLVVQNDTLQSYQRVLLPLDFSPWSAEAIALTRRLAPQAHLVLLHSFSIPFEEKLRFAGVDDATLDHYRERARRDARDHLEALVDRHSLQPDEFTLCLTEGDAPLHIVTVARERACDLIVIGKHGRQAAEELLLGSVTKHVLTEAECDVLVSTVRQG
jgi:nucleotide-binding universal stress UspA family protein